jgi:uncharacterized protein YbjQ (UPF0145 family)
VSTVLAGARARNEVRQIADWTDTRIDPDLWDALRDARVACLDELRREASDMGANAVIGIDLDYESIQSGSGGSMLMVSASGTAIKLG